MLRTFVFKTCPEHCVCEPDPRGCTCLVEFHHGFAPTPFNGGRQKVASCRPSYDLSCMYVYVCTYTYMIHDHICMYTMYTVIYCIVRHVCYRPPPPTKPYKVVDENIVYVVPFLPFAFNLGSIHGKLQLSLQGIVQPVLATKFQDPPTTRARPFQIHAFL